MSVRPTPWRTDGDVYHQMAGTIFDYWACWTVSAITDLSIADHLADGSLTAAEVAAREGSVPESTLRLMKGGVAVGLLTEEADGRFAATPLLDTLRSDNPRSLRPFVQSMMGSWLPWGQLSNGIRTGNTQASEDVFEFLRQNPDEAERFSAALTSFTGVWAPAIAKTIDTDGVQCAVDVGGASGTLLQLLQHANPDLRGIVFDRPNTIQFAEAEIGRNGLTDRTTAVGGDFFESVPSGDLLMLKFVLHDWTDEDCVKILTKCREALAPNGRVAVIELTVAKSNPLATLADINMLMVGSGRERSVEEFDALFAAAGLKRTAVLDTGTPLAVIEASAA
jgi:O-methyltransferase domain